MIRGWSGSPDNEHPDSLLRAPHERVTGQLIALIRALQPQVVVTFGPYGGYGHPDHIAIHQATVAAFRRAGDPHHDPAPQATGLSTHVPHKLYYVTVGSRTLLDAGIAVARTLRRDPRRFGSDHDIDLVRIADEMTRPTTLIPCGPYRRQKERAWRCHASQVGEVEMILRMPAVIRHRFMSKEYFTRVEPAWRRGERRELDLFDGVSDGTVRNNESPIGEAIHQCVGCRDLWATPAHEGRRRQDYGTGTGAPVPEWRSEEALPTTDLRLVECIKRRRHA